MVAVVDFDMSAVAPGYRVGICNGSVHESSYWVPDLVVGTGNVYAGMERLVWEIGFAELKAYGSRYRPDERPCDCLNDLPCSRVVDFHRMSLRISSHQ